MAYYQINAKDSYKYPSDLYKKRGYSWTTKMNLSNTIPLSSEATNYDKFNWYNPALTVESRRKYMISQGKFGISIKCNAEYANDPTVYNTVNGTMRCRLWVGSKCYGKYSQDTVYGWNVIRDEEGYYFEITMSELDDMTSLYVKKSEVCQWTGITVKGKGAEGFQIPVDTPMSGKIKFEIISFRNSGKHNIDQPLELSISFVNQDTEIQKESNIYQKQISKYQKDEYVVNTNFCTLMQDNGWTEHAIMYGTGFMQEVENAMGHEDIAESDLKWRLYDHYSHPNKIITITVRMSNSENYAPHQVIMYNGNKYAILGTEINWRNDTVKLKLINID